MKLSINFENDGLSESHLSASSGGGIRRAHSISAPPMPPSCGSPPEALARSCDSPPAALAHSYDSNPSLLPEVFLLGAAVQPVTGRRRYKFLDAPGGRRAAHSLHWQGPGRTEGQRNASGQPTGSRRGPFRLPPSSCLAFCLPAHTTHMRIACREVAEGVPAMMPAGSAAGLPCAAAL